MQNEKGSIAIALIIALICGFSILFLTNLTLIESNSNIKADKRIEGSLYQTNAIVEATTNVLLQKITSTEIPYQNKTMHALTNSDLNDIESTLNNTVLPKLGERGKVKLTKLTHSNTLEMLCDEIIEENPLTGKEEPIGVDCDASFFKIGVHLDIIGPNNVSLNMEFQDIFPEESDSGDIQLNISSLKIHLTP